MIGLDTNILIRILVKDDEAQANLAMDFIKKNKSLTINNS